MITINIYLQNTDQLLESKVVDFKGKVNNIEEARMLIVKNIDNHYRDIKYKIKIFKTFDGNESISVLFEEKLSLRRSFILKKLLDD